MAKIKSMAVQQARKDKNALGLCANAACKHYKRENRTTCSECAQKVAKRDKARAEKRLGENKCKVCSESLDRDGVRCIACSNGESGAAKARYADKLRNNICPFPLCSRMPDEGTYCYEHREIKREQVDAIRIRLKESNLCFRCYEATIDISHETLCAICVDIVKNRYLDDKYGISIEDFNTWLNMQEYKCANPACSMKFDLRYETDYPAAKRPVVDHNHETGIIRGILCSSCNLIEGFVLKNADIIDGIRLYIKDPPLPKMGITVIVD